MVSTADAMPVTAARRHRPMAALRRDFTNEAAAGGVLLLLLLLGALAMLPVTIGVVRLWAADPLRSFGVLLPLFSLIFCVQRWRAAHWLRQGTAWGLLPLVLAVLVARTYGSALVAYSFGDTEIAPLQPGLLYFTYGSGVALLLGGLRLWRALLLPLCLLLCVNPVPHLFYRFDYPLQELSAMVARSFSHVLGVQPTGTQLQMMFAPRFGMVIVPGCNGVRGSATMLYLGLLLGMVRRYPWRRTVLTMLAGLLLGYLLNFARLCCLVVYYRIAMSHPAWQGNGETVDYWIGAALFLFVTTVAGGLLLRPEPSTRMVAPRLPSKRLDWQRILNHPRWAVACCLLLLAAVPEVSYAVHSLHATEGFISPATAAQHLPLRLGPWRRGALSTESSYGRPVWQWAQYRTADGRAVDLGVWLSPDRHYAIQSQRMNGSRPLTGAEFSSTSRDGVPLELSSFTLDDAMGDTAAPIPTFFAETMCVPGRCAVTEAGFQRKGWFFANAPMAAREHRLLPILFRVLSPAGTPQDEAFQQQAKTWIADLSSNLDVDVLIRQLTVPN